MENQNIIGDLKISGPEARSSKIISEDNNFTTYLQNQFFNYKFFKKYTKIELAVHKKGNNKAVVWGLNRFDDMIATHKFSTTFYNSLFNTIRKSKSKIFYKTEHDPLPFSMNGAFLAKEYDWKNTRVVIMVSNGGFLPYDAEEIITFTKRAKNITLKALQEFEFNEEQKKFSLEKVALSFLTQINTKNSGAILTDHEQTKQIVTEFFHYNKIELFSEILNNLKHEISNPLFGILLASEELSENLKDSGNIEIYETTMGMAQNSKRCDQIIKNFQNVYDSRIGYTRVNLVDLINDSIRLTKSETRGIRVIFEKETFDNQEYFLITNPIVVGQILFNLIINAAQAIRENNSGAPSSSFIKIIINKTKQKFIISVKDNGPGIAENISFNIFSPFFTTKKRGTGLGLCICKNLASKINADLTFKNNEDSGVTFNLFLNYENFNN